MSKKDGKLGEIEMVVLRTTNNDYELNIIKELLDEHKIPYLIKDHGIGGYMRIISGNSLYGTEVLVEESIAEKAEAVLDEFPWIEKK